MSESKSPFGDYHEMTLLRQYLIYLIHLFIFNDIIKVSSQSRKSEFKVFSIVHLNIYNF